mmetsp:Transcript_80568/g.207366  ORF Transcript_80568/g.207366 Transcript_80568/m.207366 type:complete len:275 (+) Transcript_80568:583-1407(+)
MTFFQTAMETQALSFGGASPSTGFMGSRVLRTRRVVTPGATSSVSLLYTAYPSQPKMPLPSAYCMASSCVSYPKGRISAKQSSEGEPGKLFSATVIWGAPGSVWSATVITRVSPSMRTLRAWSRFRPSAAWPSAFVRMRSKCRCGLAGGMPDMTPYRLTLSSDLGSLRSTQQRCTPPAICLSTFHTHALHDGMPWQKAQHISGKGMWSRLNSACSLKSKSTFSSIAGHVALKDEVTLVATATVDCAGGEDVEVSVRSSSFSLSSSWSSSCAAAL